MALSKPQFNSKSDFTIDKRLRKGGFGAAYLVKPKRNAWTEYVLKEVNLTALDDEWQSTGVSENQRRRLLDKCRTEHAKMQEVHHPHIVQVFGAFEERIDGDSMYFMLMEFCDGGDLDRYLQKQKDPVPETLIRQWAKQLVGAISHLHEHGLIHRDIKPQNIFLTSFNTKVKVGDFGLVKDLKNQQVHQGSMTSAMSHAYASPELLSGQPADRPCDIWALGVTLYEVAHFQRPFHGQSLGIMIANILRDQPIAFNENRGYSVEFRDFTMSMLEKDPKLRPNIVKLSVTRFLSITTSSEPPTPEPNPPRREQPSSSSSPPRGKSLLLVDVSLIEQSPLIAEPMRSEICRILQDNVVKPEDLLEFQEQEINQLFGGKYGVVRAVVKWRDVTKQEMAVKRQQAKETAEKEALMKVKMIAEDIKKASQFGNVDELRKLIDGQIVPMLTKAYDNDDASPRKSVKDRLRKLLADHVKINLNVKFDDGEVVNHPDSSMLHEACARGDLALAKYLVDECGSGLTARTAHKNGHMPIHIACGKGYSKIVEWLCDGWPDAMVEAKRIDGSTPMHVAALGGHVDIVKYLVIKKRTNVEAKDSEFGRTPVFDAAQRGHLNVVKYLVEECKVNLEAKVSPFGRTPVFMAAQEGHLNVLKYLVEEGKVNLDIQSTNEYGYFIIHLAAYSGRVAVVEYLLQKRPDFLEIKAKNGQTPLQVAKAEGETQVVTFLQSKGAR